MKFSCGIVSFSPDHLHHHFQKLKFDLIDRINNIDLIRHKCLSETKCVMKDSVTRAELEGLRPDTGKMEGLETTGRVRGVIVTLLSQDSDYHFFSRYFAPW